MKWGPTGTYYFGDGTFKPLNELKNTEKPEYEARVNELLSNFRTRRAADGTSWTIGWNRRATAGFSFTRTARPSRLPTFGKWRRIRQRWRNACPTSFW